MGGKSSCALIVGSDDVSGDVSDDVSGEKKIYGDENVIACETFENENEPLFFLFKSDIFSQRVRMFLIFSIPIVKHFKQSWPLTRPNQVNL